MKTVKMIADDAGVSEHGVRAYVARHQVKPTMVAGRSKLFDEATADRIVEVFRLRSEIDRLTVELGGEVVNG